MMPKDISRTMKMPNQLIFLRYCEKDNNKTIKRHIVVQQKNNLATADRQKGRMLSDYLMAARDAFGSLLKAINSSVALVWRTIKDISGTTDGQSRLSQTSQSPTPGYSSYVGDSRICRLSCLSVFEVAIAENAISR